MEEALKTLSIRPIFAIFAAIMIFATGCAGNAEPGAIETGVALTLAAQGPTQPAEATATTATTGLVEGQICYPSEFIPQMTLYLQPLIGETVVEVPIAENQSSFQVEIDPGNYTAYAWLPDFALGGSYSQAGACGLGAACTDHTLVEFQVLAGQTTSGVDVCDWYGGPDSVPLPPGISEPTGSISGTLIYPSEFIPAMWVVAFTAPDMNFWWYVTTVENQNTYQINNLPPGTYYVMSYPMLEGIGASGGYTPAVPCGLSVECTDHSLIAVNVVANQVTQGVNPHDWYAPPGTFPANPVQ
jgi:hypothetical protein